MTLVKTNTEYMGEFSRVGGFAFPGESPLPEGGTVKFSGMSLRDWFAGQALAGIAVHPDTWGMAKQQMVVAAYEVADAMLAERTK